MVGDMAHEEDAALLFSGFGLLRPEKVADAAVDLLDGRRIVKAMPLHRSALIRLGDVAPTAGLKTAAALRRVGERRRRRR